MLQPHTPRTDSALDKQAAELADGIRTHWLYDPVLKGEYPQELLTQAQALWNVPQFAAGDEKLLKDNICDFIGLNYYKRETVAANKQEAHLQSNHSGERNSGHEFGFKDLFKFVRNPDGVYTDWDWEIYPQGLTEVFCKSKIVMAIFPCISLKTVLALKTLS